MIREAYARREIGLLRLRQSLPVFVGLLKRNAVLSQQIDKAVAVQGRIVSRRRQLPIVLAGCREQERRTAEGIGARNEVGLSAIGFEERPKPIVAKAEIQSQLRSYLPVVLKVRCEILLFIVGLVNVGGLHLVGASHEVHSTHGRCLWNQQELRAACRVIA